MARKPKQDEFEGYTPTVVPPWDPDRAGGLPGVRRTHKEIAKWPIASEAAAIDPEDIPVQQEILARSGVKTEYDRLGRPLFRDQKHRKEHCEAVGLYDRNAGYGDPAPKFFTSDYRTR